MVVDQLSCGRRVTVGRSVFPDLCWRRGTDRVSAPQHRGLSGRRGGRGRRARTRTRSMGSARRGADGRIDRVVRQLVERAGTAGCRRWPGARAIGADPADGLRTERRFRSCGRSLFDHQVRSSFTGPFRSVEPDVPAALRGGPSIPSDGQRASTGPAINRWIPPKAGTLRTILTVRYRLTEPNSTKVPIQLPAS